MSRNNNVKRRGSHKARLIVPESSVDVNGMMERLRRDGLVYFEDGECRRGIIQIYGGWLESGKSSAFIGGDSDDG